MNRRVVAIVAVGLVAAGFALGGTLWLRAYRQGETPRLPLGRDGVVFIVTDNVRADHTGLCGYERTTTPTLSALAREPGTVQTCRAYAPGSWTLPSHASFFTGESPLDHGAHEYAGTVDDPTGTRIVSRALKGEAETLAETMRADGYQTVLLAGNPVVSKGMGLTQGYAHVRSPKRFGDLDYPEITSELREILRERLNPAGGPLFLTVNLADAHRPWKAIPRGHPYLRARGRLQFDNEDPEDKWPMFFAGTLTDRAKKKFLTHITDVYDYGIERADDGVRNVLREVRESGWCRERCRIVITSDHGEHIGEHDLIDHGFYAWEENAQVYVLAQNVEVAEFPEPMSASAVYWLVRDGKLPTAMPPVEMAAWPHVRRALHTKGKAFGSVSVARWWDWQKLLWMDGVTRTYDLKADPGEQSPLEGEVPADFAALIERVKAASTLDGGSADDVMEALKAAGYME